MSRDVPFTGGDKVRMAAGWELRYLPDLTVHHAASRARDPHRRRAEGLRNTLWFA
ncbi:glycosyltransferase family 2 protein [Actinopolymorpha singaporensis]|uniref:glycosyltransferase family 2 protein n=1 Tax=Actinopolymorpha singaporensis TaxID=117157 RepID=UPI0012FD59FE|nr:hypothetical protein [Actinopolymorpha singaporensis]